ncbi:hypothetical protein DPMN_117293 [Dreissena polymorpha]|uniref:Zinc finger PHD-type domain-containing protein n=1 Tax=Dreissena polymorpha TaxID=45954 RepID=A0A9D4KQZ9_DREPO|nr:hypothetical protein DPMN_117293 [Dreissena polymorpha]
MHSDVWKRKRNVLKSDWPGQRNRRKKRRSKKIEGNLLTRRFTCGVCCMRVRVLDERKGIVWFGCYEKVCGNRYHFECLNRSEQEYLRERMEEGERWYCKSCKPWLYCEELMVGPLCFSFTRFM